MASTRLYTAELLGLATSLARWPMLDAPDYRGQARSPTCGSTVEISLRMAAEGKIAALGLRTHACAVGQASAALFAAHAAGLTGREIEAGLDAIDGWLRASAPFPAWPGLDALAAARDYPARHGAILLPWKAALAALSSARIAR